MNNQLNNFLKDLNKSHEIDEIFTYYDIPLIYSFIQKNEIYLAYILDWNKDISNWIYLKLTKEELNDLKTKKQTLYEALNNPRNFRVICEVSRNNQAKNIKIFNKTIEINKDVFLIEED